MNEPAYDTLIIGQGLAGSLLAWQLLEQGQRVMLISREDRQCASRMAAGLVNPVTGKRLVLSAQIEQYLPTALSLYQQLEQHFSQRFYHQKSMLRLFRSTDEIPLWQKRVADPDYQPYLETTTRQEHNPGLQMPLGGFRQLQTGYLDTVALLDRLDEYFMQHRACLHKTVHYKDILINSDAVHVGALQARRLIFCEGYQGSNNPWFDWLPYKPAKGEILTLKIDQLDIDEIINAGKWLLPIGDNVYRFGATYEWQGLDEQASVTAKQELLQALTQIIGENRTIKLVRHQAGVRPCTMDTRPYIGLHPQHPQLGIFNGFGSKGSLMIPYYAKQFSKFLQGDQIDFTEADIKRYWNNDL